MGMADEFFDFAVFWELMFGDEDDIKEVKCPACGRRMGVGDRIQVIEKRGIIRCPGCDAILKIDMDTGEAQRMP